MAINHFTNELIMKQNPQYTPNQFVNDDLDNNVQHQHQEHHQEIPEFTNVSNPMMHDTNFYYQQTDGSNNPNKTSFPIMSPHGVPSSNQSWNKQFSHNRNY